jgi:hypothetical protein
VRDSVSATHSRNKLRMGPMQQTTLVKDNEPNDSGTKFDKDISVL